MPSVLTTQRFGTNDLPPIAQGSTPTDLWTLTDSNGNPINLAGKEVRFVIVSQTLAQDDIDPFDATLATVSRQSTTDGSIVISGTSNNIVSVKYSAATTGAAGRFYYWLLNATDHLPLAQGNFPVKPAMW